MDNFISSLSMSVEPDIPFRPVRRHHHHTWARTFHSRPDLYFQPESIDEIRKIITLARRCRSRIITVGSGHSPSHLTCTSSWMVNLDKYSKVLSINPQTKVVVMQAGTRLHQLGLELKDQGLAMPNLGSINDQSIAGAISTATHGSSIKHGILSQSVLGLKVMLSNGQIVSCSAKQNEDLFRAALVSLGALGIIIEVTFLAVPAFNLSWHQSLVSMDSVLADWEKDLWTTSEFTRVWWFPYMKKAVKWRADKTHEPLRRAKSSWFSGRLGYHIYHSLLYIAQWIPSLLPSIEWFVIAVQYGGPGTSGVEEGRTGLLMNCLYSQFVNEWAIPLSKGPEAITRLSAWLHGNQEGAGIPFDSKGLYVHAPIEVRISDTTKASPRPYLDNSCQHGPTLYLNATLYRPYDRDPPCHIRYYEAFEWLMKDMGGRPHWAKNFRNITSKDTHSMYPDMSSWLRVQNEVDPEGMFVGDWHRKYVLPALDGGAPLPLEETEVLRTAERGGGISWWGEVTRSHSVSGRTLSSNTSEESFDMLQGAEAEKSVLLDFADDDEPL